MRAVVVPAHGGPEVLQVQTLPAPVPAPDELLIEVAGSGVNFIDVYRREGVYATQPPFVLGQECAGRVVAVGADVRGVSVGDTVATTDAHHGSHATLAAIPAERAVPMPDGVTPEVAAAAMLQGMTAHYLVNSTYQVVPGVQVLVHAAAGGVGQLLVQLAKAKGAYVVATVGSADKEAIAHALGADAVIRYDEVADLAAAVREAAGGGVHVVYDGVGKATFEASLDCLRPRGLMVSYGNASGPVTGVSLGILATKGSLYVTRPTTAHYFGTKETLRRTMARVFGAVTAGDIRPSINQRFPLAQAADAHRALEARTTTGTTLLVP